MKIIEELTKIGLTLTDEQKEAVTKKFSDDVISSKESEKKIETAEADRDKYKADYETAKATLDGFEGKDFDAITKDRDEWKKKADEVAADYAKQLHDRDYADAVKAHVDELKFTSESAKKAYIADLKEAGLTLKDGKIFGLSDFQAEYVKADPTAFITDEQQQQLDNKAKFTTPAGKNTPPGSKVTPEQLMKMKNENPNLDISQYI